jgi:hypothetical protein
MAEAKNTEKNSKPRGNPQNLILWKPGQSGNPAGRKLGTRNRKTVIMEAMRKLAAANGMEPEEIEELLQASALQAAIKKGSFFHYQELSNGLYGKITDKVDLTSGGKTLADLITIANGKAKPGAKAPAAVQG